MNETPNKPLRGPDGKLLPGTPPVNPKGRPKVEKTLAESLSAVDALARATSPMALAIVIQLMQNGDNKTKLSAALAVLDRGIGKAGDRLIEPIEITAGATAAEKADAITEAALAGKLSVSTAQSLITAIANASKIREIDELAARIAKLENMQ